MVFEFSRPMFEEKVFSSMDFEPGFTYDMYISYFVGRPFSTTLDEKNRVFAGEVDGTRPVFKEILINKLKGVLEPPEKTADELEEEFSAYKNCVDKGGSEEECKDKKRSAVLLATIVSMMSVLYCSI